MRTWLLFVLCAATACVSAEDAPSNVKDLRVLAVRTDPPEVMADPCQLDPASFQGASQLRVQRFDLDRFIFQKAHMGMCPVSPLQPDPVEYHIVLGAGEHPLR